MQNLKLSVIIPCYNEEEVIAETATRLKKVLSPLPLKDYELLFIDDGSKDSTVNKLSALASTDKQLKIISFSRNFGHQPAVAAGLKMCTGDIAVIIDADLQDPPELIPDMIKQYLATGSNVLYGVRRSREGESWFKLMTAKYFYRFINYLSEVQLPLDTGDFRLLDRSVIDAFNNLPERKKYVRGLISWLGFKQAPFYYDRHKRLAGTTKYPLFKMLAFATSSMIYFSIKPLKIALILGFWSVVVGLGLAAYTLFSYFTKSITLIHGWASLMISVIFFGGVQLLTIGLLGEYLGHMFNEIKGRPAYIVEKTLNL